MSLLTDHPHYLPDTRRHQHKGTVFRVLRSETYVPHTMPGILNTGDLLALYVLAVFWISNVTGIATGGAAALTYLAIIALAFFLPCALVTAQLGCLFPVEGSIYAWTEKALGQFWSFFVGLCAWLPGILSLVSAADVVVNRLQSLNPTWLVPAWQQGLVILSVTLFAGLVSMQPARVVQNLLNAAAIGIGLTVLLIGAAGISWLLTGHASATLFAVPANWAIGLNPQTGNIGLFGTVTLAFLGATMPLTMSGELAPSIASNSKARRMSITRHLLWGSLFVIVGYLIVTGAVLIVAGPQAALNAPNPITLLVGVVDTSFGKLAGDGVMLGVLLFFLLVAVFENVISARLLLVAGIEGRLPMWIARLNRWRVPANALLFQTGIALLYTALIFFVIPLFTALGNPANLTVEAYTVTAASLLLVWAVSFSLSLCGRAGAVGTLPIALSAAPHRTITHHMGRQHIWHAGMSVDHRRYAAFLLDTGTDCLQSLVGARRWIDDRLSRHLYDWQYACYQRGRLGTVAGAASNGPYQLT